VEQVTCLGAFPQAKHSRSFVAWALQSSEGRASSLKELPSSAQKHPVIALFLLAMFETELGRGGRGGLDDLPRIRCSYAALREKEQLR